MTDTLDGLVAAYLPPLISHLWSSTLFLLLVLGVIFLMRSRLTASARFSLALIGIIKFIVPAAAFTEVIRRMGGATVDAAALPVPLRTVGDAFRLPPASIDDGSWQPLLFAAWLMVAVALILRFTLTRHRLVSLSVRTALPPRPREVEALERARRRVGVQRSIDIARSALPEAPAVLRIFRPLIVLPAAGCDDLSDEELESLLCHECAHVARHDNLIARVESFVCALFWFHPLIWIAQRITVIDRERACDEVVSGSAGQRKTYLAALTKFCHAAIAPRLPGVSCMATAKLKERIEHVMNYASLQAHSPTPRRVTVTAATALVLFTAAAGLIGGDAFAGGRKGDEQPYAIQITATRAGESVALQTAVTENKTNKFIAAPKLRFESGERANARTSAAGLEVRVEVRPEGAGKIAVDVAIEKDGRLIQKNTMQVQPTEGKIVEERKYTGQPITMQLKDADIRDVLGTFGKLTGLDVRIDDAVTGRVSVNWINVPWDQAFDSLLRENDLIYRLEGSTIEVKRK